MLGIAADRLKGKERATILDPVETVSLSIEGQANVITAIQSLHYQERSGRIESIRN
jgi:hypothetical protein